MSSDGVRIVLLRQLARSALLLATTRPPLGSWICWSTSTFNIWHLLSTTLPYVPLIRLGFGFVLVFRKLREYIFTMKVLIVHIFCDKYHIRTCIDTWQIYQSVPHYCTAIYSDMHGGVHKQMSKYTYSNYTLFVIGYHTHTVERRWCSQITTAPPTRLRKPHSTSVVLKSYGSLWCRHHRAYGIDREEGRNWRLCVWCCERTKVVRQILLAARAAMDWFMMHASFSFVVNVYTWSRFGSYSTFRQLARDERCCAIMHYSKQKNEHLKVER